MKRLGMVLFVGLVSLMLMGQDGCNGTSSKPVATSGVKKATVKVATQSSGYTIEQENIIARYKEDNKPGSIKHLYVISAYSGQVILYSTVKGKPTSSNKRLTPYSVAAMDGQYVDSDFMGIPVNVGGRQCRTPEVLQDDGTYGHSIPYLYWWDSKGIYHQHYISGGQIVHVSNAPLGGVKSVIINVEKVE